MSKFAWVTLATNDSYSLGALVVAHSLKKVQTQHQLAILITPGVTESMRSKLNDVYDVVQLVDVLDSNDSANLAVLKRPELGITFTKFHCWNLTQFDKCVFLDADVLILQNCDELFEREELSAAPDVGWPDCFNSGVFVFKPSVDTYGKLIQFAETEGSFDGGDQGLLNQFFSDWATSDSSKRLSFLYNTASTATYSYMPAFKKFNQDIKILHFIGEMKPWVQQFNFASRQVQTPPGYNHLQAFLQLWWDLFCENVHPALSGEMNLLLLMTAGGINNLIQSNETQLTESTADDESESRSYNPYVIEYHEETNTFTYNDPWVESDHTIDSFNNNESLNETQCTSALTEPTVLHSNEISAEQEEIIYETTEHVTEISTEHWLKTNGFVEIQVDCEEIINNTVVVENGFEDESGIAGALATLSLGDSAAQAEYENQFRRANWEAGQIDYLGKDSFENILKKIHQTIEAPPAEVSQERERKRSKTPEATPQPIAAPAPVTKASAPITEVTTSVKQAPASSAQEDAPVPPPKTKKEDYALYLGISLLLLSIIWAYVAML